MFDVNKKLWSFNFGCLLAGSLVWLVQIGHLAPVPGSVTAITASLVSLSLLVFMHKGFRLCASEHTFWLLLPMLCFICLTLLIAPYMLFTLMFAAMPILFILMLSALFFRLKSQKVSIISN